MEDEHLCDVGSKAAVQQILRDMLIASSALAVRFNVDLERAVSQRCRELNAATEAGMIPQAAVPSSVAVPGSAPSPTLAEAHRSMLQTRPLQLDGSPAGTSEAQLFRLFSPNASISERKRSLQAGAPTQPGYNSISAAEMLHLPRGASHVTCLSFGTLPGESRPSTATVSDESAGAPPAFLAEPKPSASSVHWGLELLSQAAHDRR